MMIEGVEMRVGDRLLVKGIKVDGLTFWRKIKWKLRHPLKRYPVSDWEIYTVTAYD